MIRAFRREKRSNLKILDRAGELRGNEGENGGGVGNLRGIREGKGSKKRNWRGGGPFPQRMNGKWIEYSFDFVRFAVFGWDMGRFRENPT